MSTFESLNNMGLSPRNFAKLLKELRQSEGNERSEEEIPDTSNKRGIPSQPISKAKRQQIRESLKIQRRKRRRRISLYLTIVFPMALALLYTTLKDFEFGYPSSFGPVVDKAKQEQLKEDKFLFFLNDGDTWLKKGRYHNAIFQYKKAIEMYPKDYTGYYWLAVAYSYQCQNELKGCIEGKSLVKLMEIQFPNPEQLAETCSIYEPWSTP